MVSDDDSDIEISLEEVSKIYQCRLCKRCYLSDYKFAEHYPVFHPGELVALKDESTKQQGKQLSPSSATNAQDKPGTVAGGPLVPMNSSNESNYVTKEIPDCRRLAKRSKPLPKRKRTENTQIDESVKESLKQKDDGGRQEIPLENRVVEENVAENNIELITLSDSDDDGTDSNVVQNSETFVPLAVKQELVDQQDQLDENQCSAELQNLPVAGDDETRKEIKENDCSTPQRKKRKTVKVAETTPVVKPYEQKKKTPVRAFSCKWCTQKFSQLEGLKSHAMNVHIKYKIPE